MAATISPVADTIARAFSPVIAASPGRTVWTNTEAPSASCTTSFASAPATAP